MRCWCQGLNKDPQVFSQQNILWRPCSGGQMTATGYIAKGAKPRILCRRAIWTITSQLINPLPFSSDKYNSCCSRGHVIETVTSVLVNAQGKKGSQVVGYSDGSVSSWLSDRERQVYLDSVGGGRNAEMRLFLAPSDEVGRWH